MPDPNPILREIYELVGEATTAWNQVEELWYLIFTVLMHDTQREKADAIYDQFNAGSQQRELTMRIAPIALAHDPNSDDPEQVTRAKLLASLKTFPERTRTLATRRNAVMHSAFLQLGGPFQIVAMSPHKASKLRDEKDYSLYLTALIEDTTLLGLDLADLREDFIGWNDPSSLLPKPWKDHIPGYREPKLLRSEERARILQAKAQRQGSPPQPSEA
jgi:hypothetical protein